MAKRKIVTFIVIGILLLVSNTSVHADIAPPEPPSGTDPEPGTETTNVRMVSETVVIKIDADSPLDAGNGKVTATFTMRNLGDVDEQMDVRFPLDQTLQWGNLCMAPSFQYPTIDDLKVKVNGNAVPTQTTYETVPIITEKEPWPTTTIPCWANFPVSFPVGKDVTIQVTYTAQPYDNNGYNYSYVLVTGDGWKDTIGSADIIFEMPYELNETNFISCFPNDCSIGTAKVQWHYENFDPPFNITLSLLPPPLWQRIMIERENTTRNPNDGEAWGRLAKAYKESIQERRGYRSDAAGREMYQLSKTAYQKAVDLLPNDADWHYGFADLLCWNAGYNDYSVNSETEAWIECVKQIQQVFNLNPNHEQTKDLLLRFGEFEGMIDFSGSQPDYLILTPQPTAAVTPTEKPVQATETSTAKSTPTIQVTKTETFALVVASTPTSIPAQAQTASHVPVIIGVTTLLLIVILLVVKFKKV